MKSINRTFQFMHRRHKTLWLGALLLGTLVGVAEAASPASLSVTSHVTRTNTSGVLTPNGSTLRFSYQINNGSASSLTNVRLNGAGAASATCSATTAHGSSFFLGGSLAAGDSIQCSHQRTLTSAQRSSSQTITESMEVKAALNAKPVAVSFSMSANGHTRATAAGTKNTGHTSAVNTPANSQLTVIENAIFNNEGGTGALVAGDTITYVAIVYNYGTTDISGITLTDDLGDSFSSCPATLIADPTGTFGSTFVCSATYTVTANDVSNGSVDNAISVQGNDPSSNPVSGAAPSQTIASSASTNVTYLGVVKFEALYDDKNNDGLPSPGDQIRYTFVLHNSGNLSNGGAGLTDVSFSDVDLSGLTAITCETTTVDGATFSGLGTGSLVKGDAVVCNAFYTLAETDAASNISNTPTNPTATQNIAGVSAGGTTVGVASGYLTINKTSINDVGTFSFTASNTIDPTTGVAPPGPFTVTTTTPGTPAMAELLRINALNADVVVTEVPASIPAHFILTGGTCSSLATSEGAGTGTIYTLDTATNAITIPGADILSGVNNGQSQDDFSFTCTFTNERPQGTLTVIKNLIPASDPGLFDLQIDGATDVSGVGNNGTTGAITVDAGSHTVGEIGTGGASLAAYTSSISCVNKAAQITSGAGTSLAVNVADTDAVTCTITNATAASLATVKTLLSINGVAPGGRTAAPGDTLVYSIITTNSGGTGASTTLTETVPVSTTYIGTTEGWGVGCTTAATTCSQIITVAAVSAVTNTFTVKVDKPLNPLTTRQLVNVVTSSNGTCATCTVTTTVMPPAPAAPVPAGDNRLLTLLGMLLALIALVQLRVRAVRR